MKSSQFIHLLCGIHHQMERTPNEVRIFNINIMCFYSHSFRWGNIECKNIKSNWRYWITLWYKWKEYLNDKSKFHSFSLFIALFTLIPPLLHHSGYQSRFKLIKFEHKMFHHWIFKLKSIFQSSTSSIQCNFVIAFDYRSLHVPITHIKLFTLLWMKRANSQ